jgi:hypothetical protein
VVDKIACFVDRGQVKREQPSGGLDEDAVSKVQEQGEEDASNNWETVSLVIRTYVAETY